MEVQGSPKISPGAQQNWFELLGVGQRLRVKVLSVDPVGKAQILLDGQETPAYLETKAKNGDRFYARVQSADGENLVLVREVPVRQEPAGTADTALIDREGSALLAERGLPNDADLLRLIKGFSSSRWDLARFFPANNQAQAGKKIFLKEAPEQVAPDLKSTQTAESPGVSRPEINGSEAAGTKGEAGLNPGQRPAEGGSLENRIGSESRPAEGNRPGNGPVGNEAAADRPAGSEQVKGGQINNGQINNGQINNGQVNNEPVNNGQINNGQISNGQVDNEPVNNEPVNNGQVKGGQINNGQVNNGQINNGQVNNGQISNGQVNNEQANNSQVNSEQVKNNPAVNNPVADNPAEPKAPVKENLENKPALPQEMTTYGDERPEESGVLRQNAAAEEQAANGAKVNDSRQPGKEAAVEKAGAFSTAANTAEISGQEESKLRYVAPTGGDDLTLNVNLVLQNLWAIIPQWRSLKDNKEKEGGAEILVKLLKALGIDFESRLTALNSEQSLDEEQLNQLKETIKAQLMQSLHESALTGGAKGGKGDALLESLLDRLTGQQLWLQGGSKEPAYVLLHLPLRQQETVYEARIAIESGRKGSKMDIDHCRIGLIVGTPNLGEIGVDAWFFEKTLSMNIFSSYQDQVDGWVSTLKDQIQERFSRLGFRLGEIKSQGFSTDGLFEEFVGGKRRSGVDYRT